MGSRSRVPLRGLDMKEPAINDTVEAAVQILQAQCLHLFECDVDSEDFRLAVSLLDRRGHEIDTQHGLSPPCEKGRVVARAATCIQKSPINSDWPE